MFIRFNMKSSKDKCDEVFSDIIRSHGRCERCNSTYSLECAHIIPRRFNATRTMESNACCLCHVCHRFFTDNPDHFHTWIDEVKGAGYWDTLWEIARPVARVDWSEELIRLKAIAKEVGVR